MPVLGISYHSKRPSLSIRISEEEEKKPVTILESVHYSMADVTSSQAARYALGEVLLVTLSDGRPMCGEVVEVSEDSMQVEYAENNALHRAFIPLNESDDLISINEL
jgi:hypothetical protein